MHECFKRESARRDLFAFTRTSSWGLCLFRRSLVAVQSICKVSHWLQISHFQKGKAKLLSTDKRGYCFCMAPPIGIFLTAIVILITFPAFTYAWGAAGHRITGRIASAFYDSATNISVTKMLANNTWWDYTSNWVCLRNTGFQKICHLILIPISDLSL